MLQYVDLSDIEQGKDLHRLSVVLHQVRHVNAVGGPVDEPLTVLYIWAISGGCERKTTLDVPNGAAQFTLFEPIKKPSLSVSVSKIRLLSRIRSCCLVICSTHFRWLMYVLAHSVIS